jgi:hypothetical protein
VLRRIPAGGQRQRHGEGGPGDAEEEAQDQHLRVAVDAELPGHGQGGDHDDLADGAGHLGLEVVHQHAHHDAQQGAGEHRGGHHQALLGVGEAQVAGDLHAQRAEDDPHHEGEVEVQKGGQQCGRVAGLEE